MLPVVLGFDPADVVPISKEIEQDITKATISPPAQEATTAVSSKVPLVPKPIQGKNSHCNLLNLKS